MEKNGRASTDALPPIATVCAADDPGVPVSLEKNNDAECPMLSWVAQPQKAAFVNGPLHPADAGFEVVPQRPLRQAGWRR